MKGDFSSFSPPFFLGRGGGVYRSDVHPAGDGGRRGGRKGWSLSAPVTFPESDGGGGREGGRERAGGSGRQPFFFFSLFHLFVNGAADGRDFGRRSSEAPLARFVPDARTAASSSGDGDVEARVKSAPARPAGTSCTNFSGGLKIAFVDVRQDDEGERRRPLLAQEPRGRIPLDEPPSFLRRSGPPPPPPPPSMILSLAAAAAAAGSGLNSSSPPEPANWSATAAWWEEPSNATAEPAVRAAPPQPPTEVSPWDVALCATGTLISCENALVIAVLLYAPAARAPTSVLMGSLAAADLLAGLGLILNFAVTYLWSGRPRPEAAGLLSAGLLLSAFSASVLNVLAVTVDRYLSLCNALTYHTERTLTLTYAMVAAIWLACLTLGLLPALGWNCLRERWACSVFRPVTRGNALALSVAFLLVFALMMQLYLQICKIAFRHAQQIAVQHQLAGGSATTKGVSTLAAILCAFGACWLPFAAYSAVADPSYPPAYGYAAALPVACCSVINPVIYAFRNPDIQKTLWLACCACVPPQLSPRPRSSGDV
ncbi:G-protein coupled receptor 12-like [Stigmatopora nigra]